MITSYDTSDTQQTWPQHGTTAWDSQAITGTHLFFMASARAIEVDSNRSTAITTSAVVIREEKESICPSGNHQETVIGGRPAEWQQGRSEAWFK